MEQLRRDSTLQCNGLRLIHSLQAELDRNPLMATGFWNKNCPGCTTVSVETRQQCSLQQNTVPTTAAASLQGFKSKRSIFAIIAFWRIQIAQRGTNTPLPAFLSFYFFPLQSILPTSTPHPKPNETRLRTIAEWSICDGLKKVSLFDDPEWGPKIEAKAGGAERDLLASQEV